MLAYKLFKQRRDGTLGPLFINAGQRIELGRWLAAEDHPTKGFAHRPGWHCCLKPEAPHLSMHPKGQSKRVWCLVEVEGVRFYSRPESQGGRWVLADHLKVITKLEEERAVA